LVGLAVVVAAVAAAAVVAEVVSVCHDLSRYCCYPYSGYHIK